MRSKVTITLSLSCLLFSLVWAQDISARTKDDIILGINLTGTGYLGDLNYNTNGAVRYFNVLPGFQASIRKDKAAFLSPALQLGYGRIVAQNPDLSKYVVFGPSNDPNSYYEQPRYVRTDYVYGDAVMRFNPIKNPNAFARPYMSAGIGALFYFPFKNDTLSPKGLNTSRGESFSTVTGSIPLAIGTDLNLSRKISINLGTALRLPMNDYMDLYGAKLIPDRKKGNDMLLTFQVGANFRIFDAKKPIEPKIYIPPMKDALPEDTTILASADPHTMPIILRPNADYMAVQEYSLLGSYPDGWVRLTVLAQSIECDSIAKLADQRISGLYNENLQLRSQYKKLEYELNNPANISTDNDNSTQVDSLMRVVYNKENKIRELEETIKTSSPDQAGQTLGQSAEIAEYENQIAALKQEIADLKSGENTGDASLGFTELEDKYKKLATEKEMLDADYATLQDQNKSIQAELATARLSGGKTEGGEPEVLQARIDSLIQENERVMGEFNEMKKNYLVLQQDYDDLKGANQNTADLQNQLEAFKVQTSEQDALIVKLKSENEQLTGQNLSDIKDRLTQTTTYVDSMNARYARLQDAIGQYEEMLAGAKRQNDSLANETQRLQAMANANGNPAQIDSIREQSYIIEIEDLRTAVAAEQTQRKQAQEDVKISNERNAALQDSLTKIQANIQDIAHGELDLARARITELEIANKELLARVSSPAGDSLPTNLVQNLQNEVELLKRDKDELMSKNEELRRTIEIGANPDMSNTIIADLQKQIDETKREKDNLATENESLKTKITDLEAKTDANPVVAEGDTSSLLAPYISKIAVLERERDSLSRVTIAFVEEQEAGGGDEQVQNLQKELRIAESQRDELKNLVDNFEERIVKPMKAEIETLKEDNGALAAKKNELETELAAKEGTVSGEELALQVKQLESENEVMRQQLAKNVVIQDKVVELEDALASKDIELENEKRKVEELAKTTQISLIEEKENEIVELTNERNALKEQVEETKNQLSTAVTEMGVLEDKLKNAAPINPTPSTDDALLAKVEVLQSRNQTLEEEIAALKAGQPSPIATEGTAVLEAKIATLEEENAALKAGTSPIATEGTVALEAKIATLEGEKTQLEADRTNLINQMKEANPDVAAINERLILMEKENADLKAKLEANPTPTPTGDLGAMQEELSKLAATNETLTQENNNLKEQMEKLASGGNTEALVAELNTQVTQLTDENANLNAMLKRQAENPVASENADLEEKLLTFQSQNGVLLEERDRFMSMYQECAAKLEGSGIVAESGGNQLAAKEEELMQVKNQLEAVTIERDRLKAESNGTAPVTEEGNAALAQANSKIEDLQAQLTQVSAELAQANEKVNSGLPADATELLAQKNSEIERLNILLKDAQANPGTVDNSLMEQKDAKIAELTTSLSDKDAEIAVLTEKLRNGGETTNIDAEITALMTEKLQLKEELARLTTENTSIKSENAILKEASTDGNKIVELNETLDTYKALVQEKETELVSLRSKFSEPVDMQTATLTEENNNLKAENGRLDAENKELKIRLESPVSETELVQTLRGTIEALTAENARLRAKFPSVATNPGAAPTDVLDELRQVRDQNQELFNENESLRTALANALEELQNRGNNGNAGAGSDNSEAIALKAANETLTQDKADLERQVLELQGVIANAGDKDMLVTQNSRLLEENEAMKVRMRNLENELANAPKPTTDNAEVENLRAQNSELNGVIMGLQAEKSRLTAEVDNYKQISGTIVDGEELVSLRTQVASLKDQMEKNTSYVDNAIGQHEADVKTINSLEARIREIESNPSNPIASESDKDREITDLRGQINELIADNAVLKQKLASQGFGTQPIAASGGNPDLTRRISELEARERRMTQREEYIELKEEELSLEMDKTKAVKALEVELRMLQQKLKGFLNYDGEVMQDGAPCFPVSAFLGKDEVMNRINDYFSAVGYKYQIINGMMVFKNVMIPEIDKSKPLNIAFYMMISSEDNNKRVLQGSFQYASDKTYITSEKYPAQSIRSIKLLQKLSQ